MPRKITNKFGLPQPIMTAILNDRHPVAGDISVTTLLDSPRIRVLKKMYDYEEDASDLLEALFGTAMHEVLRQSASNSAAFTAFEQTAQILRDHLPRITDEAKKEGMQKVINYLDKYAMAILKKDDNFIIEKTLRMEIDGTIVFGTFDLYDKVINSLEDYKQCKTWAWIFPESRKKWRAQLSVYRYMLHLNGYEVKSLFINAFFKDWTKSGVVQYKDYPPHKIMRIPVDMKPLEDIYKFIEGRVKLHKEAEENLPLCTGTDRWAKAPEYVAKTPNVKKAVKSFGDNEELANQWLTENKHRYKSVFIEKRPGSSQRCESYCPVAKHCTQWAEEKKRMLNSSNKVEI